MKNRDPLLCLAQQLCRVLGMGAGLSNRLDPKISALLLASQELEGCQQRVETARRHGWMLAAAKVQEDLLYPLRRIATLAQEALQSPVPLPPLPSLQVVIDDLRQLEDEFDQYRLEPRKGLIAVITDVIVLEDIYLGRFSIELRLSRLTEACDSSAFEIVAKDPNPAAGNQAVTHPHVRDRIICAGDAAVPISQALREGRICDAFLLISSVLHQYNAASPYVALSEWEGQSCADCDQVVLGDDLYHCDRCGSDYCDNCISCCDVCDQSCCQSCLEREHNSDRQLCSHCRDTCPECGETFGSAVLAKQEGGLCPTCHENKQTESEESHEEHATPAALASPSAA